MKNCNREVELHVRAAYNRYSEGLDSGWMDGQPFESHYELDHSDALNVKQMRSLSIFLIAVAGSTFDPPRILWQIKHQISNTFSAGWKDIFLCSERNGRQVI